MPAPTRAAINETAMEVINMGTVYEFTRGGLKPIDTGGVVIGQFVLQAHRHQVGVVCEGSGAGHAVIFPDGSSAESQRLNALSPFTRITIVEGELATPEHVAGLIRLRDVFRANARREQEAAAQQKQRDEATFVLRLREQYPWAIPVGKLSNAARAAKNLKTELGLCFPRVKFSVKSSSYSGGNSVDLSWTLGPTTAEVEKVSSKYQDGNFDGMNDIHEYDRSAYGGAVDIVLGRAKYVMESRHYPEEIHETVGRALCALQNVTYEGQWTRNLCGQGDTTDLQSHVNQLLSRTSFGPNENYAGVEYTPAEERQQDVHHSDWCRIIKER